MALDESERRTIEKRAEYDGQYAIAAGLFALAEAVKASGSPGAVDLIVKAHGEQLRGGLDGLAEAVRERPNAPRPDDG